MDKDKIEDVIEDKLKSALADHQRTMMGDMERLFDKISDNSNLQQLDKISDILTGIPKFKRKTNEYQFNHNSKVNTIIETADQHLLNNKIQESRIKLQEGKIFCIQMMLDVLKNKQDKKLSFNLVCFFCVKII